MNWQTKKLEDVIIGITNGYSSRQNENCEGLPITRIETIQNNQLDLSRIKYAKVSDIESGKYLLDEGDILFSHINSMEHIGKVALITNDVTPILHGVNLLRIKVNSTICNPYFLYYYFQTHFIKEQIARRARKAVNQASINQTQLRQLILDIPPLSTQQQIVEKLDAIRKLQVLNTKEIEKVEELYQSKLNLFFIGDCTDCIKILLNEFIKIQGGYAFKSNEFTKDGLQLVRMGNVKKGYMDLLSNPVFLPEIYRQKYKNFLLNHGDILISMTGTIGKEDYGNVVRVEDGDGLLLNQRVGKFIIINNELQSNYLYYYCQSNYFRKQIFSGGRGIRQANVSGEQIGNIVFLSRSSQHQEEIVSELSSIETYKVSLLRKKQLLIELFESTLNKAMKGELIN